MSYENAWLTYRMRQDSRDKKYFSKVYAEDESIVAVTAVKELERAGREILGVRMEQAGCAAEAGICLRLVSDPAIGEEDRKSVV